MTKRNRIIAIIILYFSLILLFGIEYAFASFEDFSLEQIIFTLKFIGGTGGNGVGPGVIYVLKRLIIITLLVLIIKHYYTDKIKHKTIFNIKIRKKIHTIQIFPLKINIKSSLVFLLIIILYIFYSLSVVNYIKNYNSNSNFIQDNYVEPSNELLTFPKNKRNLIYIYAESLESSLMDKKNGGLREVNVIPELTKIAKNNINFSNTDNIGGLYSLNLTTWTTAGIVAQTTGLPLKLLIDGNSYGNYSSFLPGAVALGDILKENGYNNYFIEGADKEFGGKGKYLKEHGNYKIFDLTYARKNRYIDNNYFVWWGFEDQKLFEFAKTQLNEIASSNKPFNYTINTVDTHFTDGYLDITCDAEKFNEPYSNAFYCSNLKIYNFIKWCQQQDWYDNTTIIVVGDHLSMQMNYFDNTNYRYVYNAIINSKEEPIKEKNRGASTMDMFPTTLASLGVKIKGNKLGLGTNLYSNEKTLIEKYGVDKVNNEIVINSDFYNTVILKQTYNEMIHKKD